MLKEAFALAVGTVLSLNATMGAFSQSATNSSVQDPALTTQVTSAPGVDRS